MKWPKANETGIMKLLKPYEDEIRFKRSFKLIVYIPVYVCCLAWLIVTSRFFPVNSDVIYKPFKD